MVCVKKVDISRLPYLTGGVFLEACGFMRGIVDISYMFEFVNK